MNTELAQLVAVFVQATLYGVYLVTYCFCVYRYLRNSTGWRPLPKVDWPIFIIASTLWVLSTVNLAIGMFRVAEALIMKPNISMIWVGLVKVLVFSF